MTQQPMFLSVTGVSHDTAPIEVREKLALSGERIAAALGKSRSYAAECVILSTCNRFEVYTFQPQDRSPESSAVLEALLAQAPAHIESHLYSYSGSDAAAHLFKVASGIDSLILGEVQILGQ